MKRKINSWILIIVMGFVFIFTNSCKKDGNTGQVPVLTTSAISNITKTIATCGGNITSEGGATITFRGVCWSTNQTPTVADSKTIDGTGTGSFASSITGLIPNTTYFLRAYATNSSGTGYGSGISFTTQFGVIDADGNVYNTVTIGTQVWMAENLKTTKYRNGDPIPNVIDDKEWSSLTKGAYCYYNNDVNISTPYGSLYNWFTIADSRQIAPTGWHVPTDAEWTILTTTLGSIIGAGGKLKEIGTTHWLSPNTGATNESGFTALPGGYRDYSGGFYDGTGGNGLWSSTEESGSANAWVRSVSYINADLYRHGYNRGNGYSVRCIRD